MLRIAPLGRLTGGAVGWEYCSRYWAQASLSTARPGSDKSAKLTSSFQDGGLGRGARSRLRCSRTKSGHQAGAALSSWESAARAVTVGSSVPISTPD